jgi:hypothetical protein
MSIPTPVEELSMRQIEVLITRLTRIKGRLTRNLPGFPVLIPPMILEVESRIRLLAAEYDLRAPIRRALRRVIADPTWIEPIWLVIGNNNN